MNTVYVISGPAGVGKSTTSMELTKKLTRSAYISGDLISHMPVSGHERPWESKQALNLIWNNIFCLTKNFIDAKMDVVVDFVTFPKEMEWFYKRLSELNVKVKYTVLWTDPKNLLERDNLRTEHHRMGERCLILIKEFEESGLDNKYLLGTSDKITAALEEVILEIMNNPNYDYSS